MSDVLFFLRSVLMCIVFCNMFMCICYMFQHESGAGLVPVRASGVGPGEVHRTHSPELS